MNKKYAIQTIWDALLEWLEIDERAELVKKYTDPKSFVFKRSEFNAFCKEHFKDDYLTVAEKVAKGYSYHDYELGYRWIMWDETKEMFYSSEDPFNFVDSMASFIEQMVMADDPLLKKVKFIDKEIRFIKENH